MEVILASDGLIRYFFSVDNAKTSAGGFGKRLFWALTGGIPLVFVRKICRYRSITGGKVGFGRAGVWQNERKAVFGGGDPVRLRRARR